MEFTLNKVVEFTLQTGKINNFLLRSDLEWLVDNIHKPVLTDKGYNGKDFIIHLLHPNVTGNYFYESQSEYQQDLKTLNLID